MKATDDWLRVCASPLTLDERCVALSGSVGENNEMQRVAGLMERCHNRRRWRRSRIEKELSNGKNAGIEIEFKWNNKSGDGDGGSVEEEEEHHWVVGLQNAKCTRGGKPRRNESVFIFLLLKLTCFFRKTERERQIITYKNKTMSCHHRRVTAAASVFVLCTYFFALSWLVDGVFFTFIFLSPAEFLQVKMPKRKCNRQTTNIHTKNEQNMKKRKSLLRRGVLFVSANRIAVISSLIAFKFSFPFVSRETAEGKKFRSRLSCRENDLMRMEMRRYRYIIPFGACIRHYGIYIWMFPFYWYFLFLYLARLIFSVFLLYSIRFVYCKFASVVVVAMMAMGVSSHGSVTTLPRLVCMRIYPSWGAMGLESKD